MMKIGEPYIYQGRRTLHIPGEENLTYTRGGEPGKVLLPWYR
jgi:hypothetical protein